LFIIADKARARGEDVQKGVGVTAVVRDKKLIKLEDDETSHNLMDFFPHNLFLIFTIVGIKRAMCVILEWE